MTASEIFDRLAGEYDELKLRIIPGYRDVQALALRYALAAKPRRVLELGCGTGEWGATFLQLNQEAEYVAVDLSPKMRELAAARLAGSGPRAHIVDSDLNVSVPDGPFDVVVSLFAIHHVRDKQTLVRSILSCLSGGGVFLYADITVAPDPRLEQAFMDGWSSFMRKAGLDPDQVAQVLADHRDHDIPESTSAQVSYMQEAGFVPAEIIWRWEKFAVFFAARPTK